MHAPLNFYQWRAIASLRIGSFRLRIETQRYLKYPMKGNIASHAEVEKVVNPVILDDREYFWNGVFAENILVSWGNCCVNGQNLNNIDLCCLNLFQKMTNYTFCFNEYRYKMCWKGEISQKIFCLWMRMTERKIFFPPLEEGTPSWKIPRN